MGRRTRQRELLKHARKIRQGEMAAHQITTGAASAYIPQQDRSEMFYGRQSDNFGVNMPRRLTPTGERAADVYGEEAMPGMVREGEIAQQARQLEQEQKVQGILDSNQTRKFKELDAVKKTQDWYTKLLKDNKLSPQIQQSMLQKMNEAFKTFLGEDVETYTTADDSAEIQRKWQTNLVNSFEENEWADFSKNPLDDRAYGRASAALTLLDRAGVPIETYRISMNKLRAEQQETTRDQEKDPTTLKTAKAIYVEYAKDARAKGETPMSFYEWWRNIYKPLSFKQQLMQGMGNISDPEGLFQ